MYHILISLRVPQDFPGIINGDIEDAENLIADRVAWSLLELFGNVEVREVEAIPMGQDIYLINLHIEAEPGEVTFPKKNRKLLRVGNEGYSDIEPNLDHIELMVESIVALAIVNHFQEVLFEKVAISLDVSSQASSVVQLSVIQETLQSLTVGMLISTLTELHTKCWLIFHKRFADLIEYLQTRDIRFASEANLIISEITYSSPFQIKLDTGVKEVAEAIKIALDGIIQVPLRYKAMKQEIEAKDSEIKHKEREAQSNLKDKEQNRTIETQKAELERQADQLRLVKQQLEVEEQRLELQKAILKSEHQRVDLAFETASKVVERLAPNADMDSKALLIRSLVPQLLQLGDVRGLELYLPSPPKLNEP